MPFKGGSRLYSNRYHFLGGTPADATHWHTLMDNVTTAEKAIHNSGVTILEAIGYGAGSDVPLASKAYSLAGTFSPTAGQVLSSGPVAALLRYTTAARTSKNHPIYLFNYFHHTTQGNTSGTCDTLDAAQKTAIGTYASSWISGFSDGTITATRAGPNGQAATGSFVEEFLTHRDFPYTPSL
jgi:hypothetical protein